MDYFTIEAKNCAQDINNALNIWLSKEKLSYFNGQFNSQVPERLLLAMRHGTLNGGKRLRPLLLRQAASIFSVKPKKTIIAGMAVEMVHSYSLIHDDLPSMDNDDLRRGKTTVHKEFDEATAILAGDNLLTLAFEILSLKQCSKNAKIRLKLIKELAIGAGAGGMVGGQMLDLQSENKILDDEEINKIQIMKTAALIIAAIRMGAIIGRADKEEINILTKYGALAGKAFQLADDILDETATREQLGKTTKKDAKSGKATLVAKIGVKKAKQKLAEIINDAIKSLEPFGKKAKGLKQTVIYFGKRKI